MARRTGPVAVAPARPVRLVTDRHLNTPILLRIGLVVACLPVAAFAVAVHVGVTRNDRAVETVGTDATRGITVAQEIKLNLAELDGIVVEDVLDPATVVGPSGFTADYSAKREELHANLVVAAAEASSGIAYRQPLENIDYVLGHYHALVKDSFAAVQRGDIAQATALYGQAHEVMAGTLLSQAESFDKANTYVLNDAYDRHKSDAASTIAPIVGAWAVLLAFLVIVQVLLVNKFRRVFNLPLLAATVLAVISGIFAVAALEASSSELSKARERAFDPVHVMARARATAVTARQAEGQWLLEQPDAAAAEERFAEQAGRLFRVRGSAPGGVATIAQAGEVRVGAGGHLASVFEADLGSAEFRDAREALVAFGDYFAAHQQMRDLVGEGSGTHIEAMAVGQPAFDQLTDAIDESQATNQRAFDRYVRSAVDMTEPVDVVNVLLAGAVLVLIMLGLYRRLREYTR